VDRAQQRGKKQLPGGSGQSVMASVTGTYNYLELFRVREKGIPVENVELKDAVIAFAWEPLGQRFVAVTSSGDQRPDVHFYQLTEKSVVLLKTLEKKPVTHVYWSPRGQFIVLAGLRSPHNGALEFFSVNELETMAMEEHFMCTDLEWDPSGRFVASWVSHWKVQLENGYNLWTFQGKPLRHQLRDRFYALTWRPRPPSLLSAAQEAQIRVDLERRSELLEKEDRERARSAFERWIVERSTLRTQWEEYEREKLKQWERIQSERRRLFRHDSGRDEEYRVSEETVQELVEVREEIVG